MDLLRNAGELHADSWLNHVSLTFGQATRNTLRAAVARQELQLRQTIR